jgi:hypothetical protein
MAGIMEEDVAVKLARAVRPPTDLLALKLIMFYFMTIPVFRTVDFVNVCCVHSSR